MCDQWIYSACLCFGLDVDEQERTGFRYSYSVYQGEYSRNLLFTVGAVKRIDRFSSLEAARGRAMESQMDQVFDRVVDRTRARLDVPTLRTLFGAKQRPGRVAPPTSRFGSQP